ncbi:(Fe-S)-binding protein [bacterium]|nr:(Fe-S)-binding protein [bacterium]
MKHLKDFENDLNKCSKCGLCESVCPIFKINPNDCAASKGKFIMLHGVTKGDLKLSKNINKYIDMCLKCGKCNEFCPSGIDVCQILSSAKADFLKDKLYGKIINFLQSKIIFGAIINFGKFISKPFRPKKIPAQNAIQVMYFKGCVNQICPRTDIYLNKIFKNTINIVEPDFECCGLPFLSEGNMERFEQCAKSNLEKLNDNYSYFVTDCASCQSTILDYPKYINTKLNLSEKAVNWGEIIALQNLKFKFKKPLKVTFHKPCHLKNDKFFKTIMNNCENVEYVEMENYTDCCGLAGSFIIKNLKLSTKLAKQKAQNINKTNTDYVITTCPSCIAGLNYGLLLNKSKTKVVSLPEFLSKAETISRC